ncbi:hypothetical protein PV10_08360 [Exophiala mesophila]|uniref:Uncharacterized protein n=1 Tax=Exophiala mesophila TaxID=212818 RepID=A0A0D1Z1Q8_EXOME|nr:uncharacterized protein PV10_08360 [Exophiala mesophila]KIV88702.1 hypothetical protein PV10_08360 [Exophiala mesophila]
MAPPQQNTDTNINSNTNMNMNTNPNNPPSNLTQPETPEDARFRRFCTHYMDNYTATSDQWIVRGTILRVAQSYQNTSQNTEILNLFARLVAQFISCDPIAVLRDPQGAMVFLERWKNFEDVHGPDRMDMSTSVDGPDRMDIDIPTSTPLPLPLPLPLTSISASASASWNDRPVPVKNKKRKCPFSR